MIFDIDMFRWCIIYPYEGIVEMLKDCFDTKKYYWLIFVFIFATFVVILTPLNIPISFIACWRRE